jgi:peroxiredoxin
MRNSLSIGVLLLLVTAALALPAATLPRPSPEFVLAPPGGSTVLLSSLKGRVVVMEFLFAKSEHCMRVAQMLDKLQTDLGSQGLQAVGVVFDPPNGVTSGAQIEAMVSYFRLNYPMTYSSRESVDSYLDRAKGEVLNIPLIVVVDRKGNIRAASSGKGGDPKLEDENSLRTLVGGLLKEGG